MTSERIHNLDQIKRYMGILSATTLGMAVAIAGPIVVLWHASALQSGPRVAAVLFAMVGLVQYLATLVNLLRLRRETAMLVGNETTTRSSLPGSIYAEEGHADPRSQH
jgi:hypothetical protein